MRTRLRVQGLQWIGRLNSDGAATGLVVGSPIKVSISSPLRQSRSVSISPAHRGMGRQGRAILRLGSARSTYSQRLRYCKALGAGRISTHNSQQTYPDGLLQCPEGRKQALSPTPASDNSQSPHASADYAVPLWRRRIFGRPPAAQISKEGTKGSSSREARLTGGRRRSCARTART